MGINVDRAAEAARVAAKLLSDLEEFLELHADLAERQAQMNKRSDTKDVVETEVRASLS
jgi:hypothetical protein